MSIKEIAIKYNESYAPTRNMIKSYHFSGNHPTRLSTEDWEDIENRIAAGESQSKVAADYGVSQTAISNHFTHANTKWYQSHRAEMQENVKRSRKSVHSKLDRQSSGKRIFGKGERRR